MLFKKSGFPEEGEFVLCTITKVIPNSVFVKIDEYGSSGMIHISEISPGRIRNIRDFVKEGKKVVCMVLKINQERGHIDLSLRRVNESQKKKKIEYIKQLQKVEKIIEFVAEKLKIPTDKLFQEIVDKSKKEYSDPVILFGDVVNEGVKLTDYGISHAEELEEVIKQRIKPPEAIIEGELSIKCFEPSGLNIIKKTFADHNSDKVTTSYLGGGRYYFLSKGKDYKTAEEQLDKVKEPIISTLKEHESDVSYKRLKKK